jgi:hypothetical protein
VPSSKYLEYHYLANLYLVNQYLANRNLGNQNLVNQRLASQHPLSACTWQGSTWVAATYWQVAASNWYVAKYLSSQYQYLNNWYVSHYVTWCFDEQRRVFPVISIDMSSMSPMKTFLICFIWPALIWNNGHCYFSKLGNFKKLTCVNCNTILQVTGYDRVQIYWLTSSPVCPGSKYSIESNEDCEI